MFRRDNFRQPESHRGNRISNVAALHSEEAELPKHASFLHIHQTQSKSTGVSQHIQSIFNTLIDYSRVINSSMARSLLKRVVYHQSLFKAVKLAGEAPFTCSLSTLHPEIGKHVEINVPGRCRLIILALPSRVHGPRYPLDSK